MTPKAALLKAAALSGLSGLARRATASQLRVLCYHGLWLGADKPYGNCLFMTPAMFEGRMRRLRQSGRPVLGLGEAVARLAADDLPPAAVVITIDDGWASTHSHMLPILERYELPATLYATTWYSGRDLPVVNVAIGHLLDAEQDGLSLADFTVFEIEERPLPVPEKGQVLISVKAFGLNRSELMTRKGLSPDVRFPRVLGIECVGVVEIDPDRELEKGQKVFAFMGGMGRDFDGSYQEYAVLPKTLLYAFESKLGWKELGAIPEMFQTAYGSLHLALKIKQNETLLIRGGTSSIGMLATQLAKKSGLKVIATTRKPAHKPLLLSNGADHVVIDDGELEAKVKAISFSGADKVLELVGTSTLKDSLACVVSGGIVCI
ncbi:MAG: hypothetical protein EOP50_08545 [Sphingobacteriales bacterium]|nr:MAG: hypothetical protein EOP50_08545 [Sphingobacteriales bacterium]